MLNQGDKYAVIRIVIIVIYSLNTGYITDRGRGFFLYPLRPDRLWGPPSLPVQRVLGALSPGVKRGRAVMLTSHPLLVPRLRKRGAIPPLIPSAFMASGGSTSLPFLSLVKHEVRNVQI
jgi:hypothetical protein